MTPSFVVGRKPIQDASILHLKHAIGIRRDAVIMGYEQDAAPPAVDSLTQQAGEIRGGFGIKIAGGFIRQDE
jgi:hypothetical protein